MGIEVAIMLRSVLRPARTLQRAQLARPFSSAVVTTEARATTYPAPVVGTTCPVYKSDAEARIAMVAPIGVHGSTARCDGGGGPLGHPVEYIQLNTKTGEPVECKYCGLRFFSNPLEDRCYKTTH